MIRLGQLPVILTVGEKEWKIRTDYRDILVIMQAFNDPELMLETSPIDVVQTLLGHEKLDTTKIYAKTSMMVIKDNFYRSHL